jgi:hypothetical protein
MFMPMPITPPFRVADYAPWPGMPSARWDLGWQEMTLMMHWPSRVAFTTNPQAPIQGG